MTDDRPFAFHDLPASSFPFTIEFLNVLGIVVHAITVDGPGGVIIPGLAEQYGPVKARIRWPDGSLMEE